jgi:hypothetical protein
MPRVLYSTVALTAALVGLTSAACPCSDPALCKRVEGVPNRKEVFGFQVTPANWPFYPWDVVTTVCAFSGVDPDMVCHAHANKARVSVLAPYPAGQLQNATFLQEFIDGLIAQVGGQLAGQSKAARIAAARLRDLDE